MMEEYNTHTHTQIHTCAKHIDILLLTISFTSMSAPETRSDLKVSASPLEAAKMRAVLLSWWKYYNWRKYDIKHYYQAHSVIWHSHAQYHIIIYNIKVYNKSNQIKQYH